MLASITLENFFSFGEATKIDLSPGANMLVGINGSGKSNLMKAIYLLKEAIAGKGFEKVFLQEWGGFNGAVNFGEGERNFIRLVYEFDKKNVSNANGDNLIYELTIAKAGDLFYSLYEKVYYSNSPGQLLLQSDGEGTKIPVFNQHGNIKEDLFIQYSAEKKEVSKHESSIRQIKSSGNSHSLIMKCVEMMAIYDDFDTSSKSTIRKPSQYSTESQLLPSGENLTSILNHIQANHGIVFERFIEEKIKAINPNFKTLGFGLIGNFQTLSLREQGLNKSIPMSNTSNGTLQFLLLLSIFYNPDRGKLICIDEPENNLHPDMIGLLAEAIKHAANDGTQVLVATHSPILLNAFDVEDVLVFEKNDNNETVVLEKSEDDLVSWKDGYLLGNAWVSGQIGGKRW